MPRHIGENTPTIAPILASEVIITPNGLRAQGRGKFEDDLDLTNKDKGLLFTALNDTKWMVWVDNSGTIFTTQVAASPEISFEERVAKIQAQINDINIAKSARRKNNLEERVAFLEKLLRVNF